MKIGLDIKHKKDSARGRTVIHSSSRAKKPVRSLVQVRFENDGRVLAYYNDLFDLSPGDRVFVSGKLSGKPGIVESVTTKFKINLVNYERVIAVASMEIHGTYEKIADKMVSYDSIALSPDQFRGWCKAPKSEEEEIIIGDGYEIGLSDIAGSNEIIESVFERAVGYCQNGNVAYISIIGGIGTAFIQGTEWYEVNFRYEDGHLFEMYCECPYPGLCKHLLAVAITLHALEKEGLEIDSDFVLVDGCLFWRFVSKSVKKVTL